MKTMIALPEPVAKIYEAVAELEALYPERKFTPDGHLVGSIGEVIAAETYGFQLLPMSMEGHDAIDSKGRLVQIKLTGGKRISMYGPSDRLVVMKLVRNSGVDVVYDGCGKAAWESAGKLQKNGQRSIALSKLQSLK